MKKETKRFEVVGILKGSDGELIKIFVDARSESQCKKFVRRFYKGIGRIVHCSHTESYDMGYERVAVASGDRSPGYRPRRTSASYTESRGMDNR